MVAVMLLFIGNSVLSVILIFESKYQMRQHITPKVEVETSEEALRMPIQLKRHGDAEVGDCQLSFYFS